jgi:hypothetical protein
MWSVAPRPSPLARQRDSHGIATRHLWPFPHTRSYRGCRWEGGSNAQTSVVDQRPVPRSGRRIRRRIHVPGPRQRNHRGAIALVEHGALDCDWCRGRPTCAGADLRPATDILLVGANSTGRRAPEPPGGPAVGSRWRSRRTLLERRPRSLPVMTAHSGAMAWTISLRGRLLEIRPGQDSENDTRDGEQWWDWQSESVPERRLDWQQPKLKHGARAFASPQ